MARPHRCFRTTHIYHVVQRGNKGQLVFLDDPDFQFHLNLLFRKAAQYKVTVLDFCLTPTQGHWLLRPATRDGISNLMRDMQSQTSKHLNAKYKDRPWKFFVASGTSDHDGRKWWRRQSDSPKAGVNWAPRFYATELEPGDSDAIRMYLHYGPVRAGLCVNPASYRWTGMGLRTAWPDSWKLEDPTAHLQVTPFTPPERPAEGQVDLDKIFSQASRSRMAFCRVVARFERQRPMEASCRVETTARIRMEPCANSGSLPCGP